MSRITMSIEEEFSGKVIGSFDLTEYADRVYNQALEELADFFHRDYVFDSICRDDCTQAYLVDLVDDFVKQLKR